MLLAAIITENWTQKDTVTIGIALVGLVLSIYNFYIALRKDRRKFSLNAFWTDSPDDYNSGKSNYLVLRVTNFGSRRIAVSRVILWRDGLNLCDEPIDSETARILHRTPQLPKEIEDGQSCSLYFGTDELPSIFKTGTAIVFLSFECRLSTGETKWMKNLRYDVRQNIFPDLTFI